MSSSCGAAPGRRAAAAPEITIRAGKTWDTQTGLAMQGIAIPDEMAIRKTKDSWLLQVMLELLLCFMWDFRLY